MNLVKVHYSLTIAVFLCGFMLVRNCEGYRHKFLNKLLDLCGYRRQEHRTIRVGTIKEVENTEVAVNNKNEEQDEHDFMKWHNDRKQEVAEHLKAFSLYHVCMPPSFHNEDVAEFREMLASTHSQLNLITVNMLNFAAIFADVFIYKGLNAFPNDLTQNMRINYNDDKLNINGYLHILYEMRVIITNVYACYDDIIKKHDHVEYASIKMDRAQGLILGSYYVFQYLKTDHYIASAFEDIMKNWNFNILDVNLRIKNFSIKIGILLGKDDVEENWNTFESSNTLKDLRFEWKEDIINKFTDELRKIRFLSIFLLKNIFKSQDFLTNVYGTETATKIFYYMLNRPFEITFLTDITKFISVPAGKFLERMSYLEAMLTCFEIKLITPFEETDTISLHMDKLCADGGITLEDTRKRVLQFFTELSENLEETSSINLEPIAHVIVSKDVMPCETEEYYKLYELQGVARHTLKELSDIINKGRIKLKDASFSSFLRDLCRKYEDVVAFLDGDEVNRLLGVKHYPV